MYSLKSPAPSKPRDWQYELATDLALEAPGHERRRSPLTLRAVSGNREHLESAIVGFEGEKG